MNEQKDADIESRKKSLADEIYGLERAMILYEGGDDRDIERHFFVMERLQSLKAEAASLGITDKDVRDGGDRYYDRVQRVRRWAESTDRTAVGVHLGLLSDSEEESLKKDPEFYRAVYSIVDEISERLQTIASLYSYYFGCVPQISELDKECGEKFKKMAKSILAIWSDIDIVCMSERLSWSDISQRGEIIKISRNANMLKVRRARNCMEEYFKGVKFLIEKSKPYGSIDFKPEGLLARALENREEWLVANSFNNPVFLNYLYERRLPAYSWSAKSGEEMMRAVTTGDYRANYDAEKQLIKRVVRDIGERYG